jgi:hypothetical protein
MFGVRLSLILNTVKLPEAYIEPKQQYLAYKTPVPLVESSSLVPQHVITKTKSEE